MAGFDLDCAAADDDDTWEESTGRETGRWPAEEPAGGLCARCARQMGSPRAGMMDSPTTAATN